ncbi:hypothetical protein RRG08_033879 [Elysia crispata]|uniref:Uncharacterized protein n=1 Tax=Elysia crispata TaxID=231223 RepID=A0AAE1B8X2_9GAST|nr:hypothetical protein RRG08_033879 [Elysia crispata]
MSVRCHSRSGSLWCCHLENTWTTENQYYNKTDLTSTHQSIQRARTLRGIGVSAGGRLHCASKSGGGHTGDETRPPPSLFGPRERRPGSLMRGIMVENDALAECEKHVMKLSRADHGWPVSSGGDNRLKR